MSISNEKISSQLIRLTAHFGQNNVNSYLLLGKEKNILIDTGYEGTKEALKKAIEEISSNPLLCIINTHHHFDHTGGNDLYDCPLIAHEKARERIGGKFFYLPSYNRTRLPDISVSSEMIIHLDGEILRIKALEETHSDNDLLVYLEKEKALIMGDLLFSETLPFVDLNSGGHIANELRTYDHILELFPRCETFLAGHGPKLSRQDFVNYSQIIQRTYELIVSSLKKEDSKETILQSRSYRDLLDQLPDGEKFDKMWIESIETFTEKKIPLVEKLTEILETKGLEESLELFHQSYKQDGFIMTEQDINLMAYNLMFRERYEEAEQYFRLYVQYWPESANSWDSLGEFLLDQGNDEEGRTCYEKALAMDQERGYIKEILEKIGNTNNAIR